MNKTEQLMAMLEFPDRYSNEQWQEILADEECRELYSMLAKTKGAFVAETAASNVTDEMIDDEWKRLAKQTPHIAEVPLWRKIAAAAAIVVAFFGITIAAVQTGFFGVVKSGSKADTEQVSDTNDKTSKDGESKTESVETETDSEIVEPILFDDVVLEQVLTKLSTHYHVNVEYRSEDVRSLRLYYEWQPDYTIDKVIDMLNNFEAFTIHREGNKLIVESHQVQEDKQ